MLNVNLQRLTTYLTYLWHANDCTCTFNVMENGNPSLPPNGWRDKLATHRSHQNLPAEKLLPKSVHIFDWLGLILLCLFCVYVQIVFLLFFCVRRKEYKKKHSNNQLLTHIITVTFSCGAVLFAQYIQKRETFVLWLYNYDDNSPPGRQKCSRKKKCHEI